MYVCKILEKKIVVDSVPACDIKRTVIIEKIISHYDNGKKDCHYKDSYFNRSFRIQFFCFQKQEKNKNRYSINSHCSKYLQNDKKDQHKIYDFHSVCFGEKPIKTQQTGSH